MSNTAVPSAPASPKGEIYLDSTALNSVRSINYQGRIDILSPNSRANLLINGGFTFAQRQAPGTLTTLTPGTTNRAYSADRWAVGNGANDIQYQRIDTVAAVEAGLSARFYGKLKKITAVGKIGISQVVEAATCFPLRGRTVRFSCKMKYSVAASMSVRLGMIVNQSAGTVDAPTAALYNAWNGSGVDPTLGANLAYVAPSTTSGEGGTINGNAYDIVLTSAWVKYSGVFLIPAGTQNVIPSVWTNTTRAVNDELNISECSLTDGYELQDWSAPAVSDELIRCQRFYAKTFAVDTAPATNVGVNTGEFKFMSGLAGIAGERSPSFRYPVTMRITPSTITTYNPAAVNAQVRDETAAADLTATAVAGANDSSLGITCTGLAGTLVGSLLGVHLSLNAEIP